MQRPTIPRGCPQHFAKLLNECWHKEPKERASFKRILSVLDHMLDNSTLARSLSVRLVLVLGRRTSSSRARCFCRPVVRIGSGAAHVRVRVRADELRQKTEAFLHNRSNWMYVILIRASASSSSSSSKLSFSLPTSRSTVLYS